MSDKVPMTITGKTMLEEELKNLLQEERPAVIKAIEDARALGDLSENADYDAAKEKQAWIESRIAEVQTKIATAEVIDPTQITSEKIVFGAHVELLDLDTDETVVYQIVGVDEADVKQGKVSVMSPIARSLIGRGEGDNVEVSNPKGVKEYEVMGISYK